MNGQFDGEVPDLTSLPVGSEEAAETSKPPVRDERLSVNAATPEEGLN